MDITIYSDEYYFCSLFTGWFVWVATT